MLSTLRIIKFAIQDIYRNLSLSIMTILILVLMMLSINTVITVNVLTNQASLSIKDQIDVSVYFSDTASDKEIEEVIEYISAFTEVNETNFYTRDEVLEQFRRQHEGNEGIIAALDELDQNPLGATLVVKTSEPQYYQKIIKALSVPEYENIIEAKTFGDTEKAIERIDIITNQVEKFSIALATIFGVIAFLIIFNTIRVSVYSQRIEISIKKLVGATNWFIRGPYIINAIIFSFISTAIPRPGFWIRLFR